jgi:hypothetical protein
MRTPRVVVKPHEPKRRRLTPVPDERWWQPLRLAANGRLEVHCRTCDRLYWLTTNEQSRWPACPHCLGWWTWPPENP